MERVASAVVTIYILAIFVSPARPVLATEFGGMRIAALATGGASALDEYLLLEATADSVDPSTLEVAYRSASGLTTRRLIDLTVLGVSSLPGGSKILIANGVGRYAPLAAATWSDGIASTGGAVILRDRNDPARIVDALSWGSAVAAAGGEGAPAPAPPNTSVLERLRSAGALVDTGDNATDFAVVPTPANPLDPPMPPSSPTPAPTSTPTPTPTPTPSPAATPTPAPTDATSPSPSPSTTPTALPVPTVEPSSTASPLPSAVVVTSRAARSATLGTRLTVEGVVTAIAGELAEPRLAAVADLDGGAGLFAYLAPSEPALRRGDLVHITGVLTLRRQALTIVASQPSDVLSAVQPPPAVSAAPVAGAWAWEGWEARHVRIAGQLVGAPSALAGGALSLRLRLAHGETLLLAAAAPIAAQIPAALRTPGLRITATGLLHQRGGAAGGGYRLWIDPVAGIVPITGGGGALPSGAPGRSNGGRGATPRQLAIPLGTPSFGAQLVGTSAWLRAVSAALEVSTDELHLVGATRVRLVALPVIGGRSTVGPLPPGALSGRPVRGSCSTTRTRALTVRGGLPILRGGDGSWGLSRPPGSTRSACRRPL